MTTREEYAENAVWEGIFMKSLSATGFDRLITIPDDMYRLVDVSAAIADDLDLPPTE